MISVTDGIVSWTRTRPVNWHLIDILRGCSWGDVEINLRRDLPDCCKASDYALAIRNLPDIKAFVSANEKARSVTQEKYRGQRGMEDTILAESRTLTEEMML